jgi:hypothetical protein
VTDPPRHLDHDLSTDIIAKFQNTPDMSAVIQALAAVQNDLKTTAETVRVGAIAPGHLKRTPQKRVYIFNISSFDQKFIEFHKIKSLN